MQTEDFRKEFNTFVKSITTDDMFIGIPALVKKFDEKTQLLDVQPLIKELYNDEEENFYVELPMIQNVPFNGNLNFGIFCVTFPVSVGAKVWLTGSNISLDDLLELDANEPIDIRETRQFDLSDMVAIADFKTKKSSISDYDKDNFTIRLKDNSVYLKIKPNGECILKGSKLLVGSDEANKALALAEKTNNRLGNIESFLNSHIHIDPLSGVTGVASVPYAETVGNVASAKVFTND